MQCKEFRELAGAWMEGEAPREAQTHVANCLACSGLVAQLRVITYAAAELADDTPEPPARVWTAVRAQLEAEGLIREPARRSGPIPAGWLSGLFDWAPRPALAGAYLGLLLAAALLVGVRDPGRLKLATDVAPAQPAMVSLQPRLSRSAEGTVSAMHEHNPAVTASYTQCLAQVDNFIRLCEKTVQEQPRNELAREYLYSAYQQKAELLTAMAERGATGD